MTSPEYQITRGDLAAAGKWVSRRLAEMPPEAVFEFQSYVAVGVSVSGLTGFITRWLNEDFQRRLYTTIRVARHRRERARKNIPRRNLAISPETYDKLKELASWAPCGPMSITRYLEGMIRSEWYFSPGRAKLNSENVSDGEKVGRGEK